MKPQAKKSNTVECGAHAGSSIPKPPIQKIIVEVFLDNLGNHSVVPSPAEILQYQEHPEEVEVQETADEYQNK
jgi:hypothetical protein